MGNWHSVKGRGDGKLDTATYRLDELPEVRPFPASAMKIASACNQAGMTASDLCELMQCDPAIVLKILRVANSAVYGMPGRVNSLRQAIVVLGFRAVRNLALTVAAAEVFTSDGETWRQSLWSHSLACATVATLLSQADGISHEQAFLAGVVHDAGKLILLDAMAEKYLDVISTTPPDKRIAAEREVFGTDHQELGLRCADEWGLPLDIAMAISNHHDPLDPNVPAGLVDVVSVANGLSRHWGLGLEQPDEQDVDRMISQAPLRLQPADLNGLWERAQEGFESLQASFQA